MLVVRFWLLREIAFRALRCALSPRAASTLSIDGWVSSLSFSPPRRRQPDYDRVVNFTGILLKGGCTTSAAAGAVLVLSPDTVSSLYFIPLMRCFLRLAACFLFALFMFFIGHFVAGCRGYFFFDIQNALVWCGLCRSLSGDWGRCVCAALSLHYSRGASWMSSLCRWNNAKCCFCLCACIQISSAFCTA